MPKLPQVTATQQRRRCCCSPSTCNVAKVTTQQHAKPPRQQRTVTAQTTRPLTKPQNHTTTRERAQLHDRCELHSATCTYMCTAYASSQLCKVNKNTVGDPAAALTPTPQSTTTTRQPRRLRTRHFTHAIITYYFCSGCNAVAIGEQSAANDTTIKTTHDLRHK